MQASGKLAFSVSYLPVGCGIFPWPLRMLWRTESHCEAYMTNALTTEPTLQPGRYVSVEFVPDLGSKRLLWKLDKRLSSYILPAVHLI